MIKAIILDFDGVIHDTMPFLFDIQKKLIKGLTLEGYKDLYNGNIFDSKLLTPELLKKFYVEHDQAYKKLIINKEIKAQLLLLKDKFDLYIISSNKELILNEYFENNGILAIFKKVLGMETHKSKEKKFRLLFEKYGLQRDDCVFVTDTLGDILEANKLGLRTIAVDYGFHERARLEKGQPERIISDLAELLPIIDGLNKK